MISGMSATNECGERQALMCSVVRHVRKLNLNKREKVPTTMI